MSTQFSFDPAFLAIMLVIPIGIIIVVWIALRKYFETRQVGFLSIALAFMLTHALLPIFSLLPSGVFMATVWFSTGVLALFFVLIAYGLLKLSSGPLKSTQLPSGEKLNLNRQLSLLAGITMLMAVFYVWITYDYSYSTPTASGSRGGSFYLLDAFLLPSTFAQAELEQININTLIIAATLAGILFLVAGLGCIVKDAKWGVLSVAGLIAFFFAYVGSPGANLIVATGAHSSSSGATGWQMALSLGFILGTLGVAIGLAALIHSIAATRIVRIT